jgi:hypothetical protein
MVAVTKYCFDSPNPVTKTILLQEFFGKIFKISFRKRNSRGDRDLGVTLITMLLRSLDYADFVYSPSRVILILSPS